MKSHGEIARQSYEDWVDAARSVYASDSIRQDSGTWP